MYTMISAGQAGPKFNERLQSKPELDNADAKK
jgi:hypothetical protein